MFDIKSLYEISEETKNEIYIQIANESPSVTKHKRMDRINNEWYLIENGISTKCSIEQQLLMNALTGVA